MLDVVYNHLSSSGPLDYNSVLDKVASCSFDMILSIEFLPFVRSADIHTITFEKIVPGYYLRRDADGAIENTTCMNDTASEHYMVERLILDDLKSWAVNYKVIEYHYSIIDCLVILS